MSARQFDQEYGPAIPEIVAIRLDPSDPEVGDAVEIEVDIRDTATTLRGEDDWNIFYVTITSPQLNEHILHACEIIKPGQTVTRDDSTGDRPGLDGEFSVVSEAMQVEVEAGGIRGEVQCVPSNFPSNGIDVVRSTVTLAAKPTPSFARDVSITGKRLDPSGTVDAGDTVTFTVDVENTGETAYSTTGVFTNEAGQRVGIDSISRLSPGSTGSLSTDFEAEAPETKICCNVTGKLP